MQDGSVLIDISTGLDAQRVQDALGHPTDPRHFSDGKLAHEIDDCLAVELEHILTVWFVLVGANLFIKNVAH